MPGDPNAIRRSGGEKEIKDTVQPLDIKTFRKFSRLSQIPFRRLHPKSFIATMKHFIPQERQEK